MRPYNEVPSPGDPHRPTASVARGVIQHIRDDARFHQTRAFAELSLELSAMVRDVPGEESDFRPAFLGHLLVEVLLDAALIAEDTARLEAYYRTIASVDPGEVEDAVNRIAPKRTTRLALMISRFSEARILWDYLEDAKLWKRLNQVMRRAKLAPVPESFLDLLPEARRRVDRRKAELILQGARPCDSE